MPERLNKTLSTVQDLEALFNKSNFPNQAQKEELINKHPSVNYTQVNQWFKTRRRSSKPVILDKAIKNMPQVNPTNNRKYKIKSKTQLKILDDSFNI